MATKTCQVAALTASSPPSSVHNKTSGVLTLFQVVAGKNTASSATTIWPAAASSEERGFVSAALSSAAATVIPAETVNPVGSVNSSDDATDTNVAKVAVEARGADTPAPTLAAAAAADTAAECVSDAGHSLSAACLLAEAHHVTRPSRPAFRIRPSLEVLISSNLAKSLRMLPGHVMLLVELDGFLQEQHPAHQTRTFSHKSGVRIFVSTVFRAVVEGMFHRGWKLAKDGTLLLVVSRHDSTRMTLEECGVGCTYL